MIAIASSPLAAQRGGAMSSAFAKGGSTESDSVYYKWKRQLEVGVQASSQNSRPLKSADLKRLEAENRKRKEALLNQALLISELKKEMSLD